MADVVKYTNAGALWLAGKVKTALVNCKMRLFKDGMGIVVSPSLVVADLIAAEADYTGYVEKTIAAMSAPLLNPVGGASISTGEQQFQIDAPYTVTNVIGGGWIEDSTGALVMAWSYGEAKPLVGAGDGIPVTQILVFG
jgi:hypothetical protein